MTKIKAITVVACTTAVFSAITLASAAAQDNISEIAGFYRGKQIRIIIRSGPGGGYDLYSRLLGRHIINHIPGNPTMVAQNMPAGGGLAAINYVAEVAPQDGTVITMIAQSLVMDQALGYTPNFKYDLRTFHWLGNLTDSNVLTYTWTAGGIKVIEDAYKREVSLGSTGPADVGSWLPGLYNAVLGTHFKIINGYQSGPEIRLAMERGELDGMGANPLASLMASTPQFVTEKQVSVLVQVGLKREKELPGVPLLTELARTAEDREVLTFVTKAMAVGRPIGVAPGVPAERVKALRRAFNDTLRDAAFIDDAKKGQMDIIPQDGETVQRLVEEAQGTPAALRDKVRAMMPPRS